MPILGNVKRRVLPFVTALVLLAALQPQAQAVDATVVVVGSLVTVKPADAPAGAASASLTAARNEFESFQVVVRAGASTLTGVTVLLETPLSGPGGTIPAQNVTIYREAYIDLVHASDLEGGTGRWPDALIPAVDPFYAEARNAFPVTVPAGENRVAWVDVLVPIAQAAGAYDGTLRVTGDGGLDVAVPVHLEVLSLELPSTSSMRSAFGMDWDGGCPAHYGDNCINDMERGWALKSLYVRAALEDRVTISYSEYQPPVPGEQRQWFRTYILPLLQGTSPVDPEGLWTPVRLPGARLTSVQVDGGSFLHDWRTVASNGGFVKRAFLYACDEPNTDAATWRYCKRQARNALDGWPKLRILITATIRNAKRFDAAGLIDLLVPVVNQMDDKASWSPYYGNQRSKYDTWLASEARNQLWTYTSCMSHGCSGDSGSDPYWAGWPSYVIDQPGSEHRATGFLAFEYASVGDLYFATDYDLTTAWTDQWSFGGNGDGTLFYPGMPARIGGTHDIPLDSIRLKRIRDGREDYEYLLALEAAGLRTEAMTVARGLFPTMYETNVSQAEFDAARQSLIDLFP